MGDLATFADAEEDDDDDTPFDVEMSKEVSLDFLTRTRHLHPPRTPPTSPPQPTSLTPSSPPELINGFGIMLDRLFALIGPMVDRLRPLLVALPRSGG